MIPRYFTVSEANELLPTIEPLLAELLQRRARIVRARKQIEPLLTDLHSNVGGAVPSEMTQEFVMIERLLEEIQSHGCIVKDMNAGLVDFLAKIEGRDVYLCWRYGETEVAYYHELHTGYNGRQPV